jgi:hypothetical protein
MGAEILEKATREAARWRVLWVLNSGRPAKLPENIILTCVTDANIPMTPTELRRELDYLRDRKLVEIYGEGTPTWSADLTRLGVDVVEYTVDCDPGIARPRL